MALLPIDCGDGNTHPVTGTEFAGIAGDLNDTSPLFRKRNRMLSNDSQNRQKQVISLH